MLVVKISTLVLIIIIAFILGCIFSPIVMLIDKVKDHKKNKENKDETDN